VVLIAVANALGCAWFAQRRADEEAARVHGGLPIHGDDLPEKTVVLTFDDGPDDHTLTIARYLAEVGVHATFFVNGRRFCRQFAADGSCAQPAETRPCNDGTLQASVTTPRFYPVSLLADLVALGHRVGNHTQDHCDLTDQVNPTDFAWEIEATQALLDPHILDGLFLFRAPFGRWDLDAAKRANLWPGFARLTGPVAWDIDGADWDCWKKGMTPEACAHFYFDKLGARPKRNGIILLHDRPEFNVGYEGPLLLTKILVPALRAQGYRFVTLESVPTIGARLTPPRATAADR
jgi:peptidoglycan/xylan/chitin deacetylase (PgdA/CDA1 family)